jgi:site-specific DNA recombinase
MKYFIYVRKSTDVEDKQVLSVEAQIVELKEYAAKYELQVVDTFIEKRTAKKPGRPILNKMLQSHFIWRSQWHFVVVARQIISKLDR